MASARIRYRHDSAIYADYRARAARGEAISEFVLAEAGDTPPAQPGDIWTVRWYKATGRGPIAGYSICCPRCLRVHSWTTALNCGSRQGGVCQHNGTGSCWGWTGSAARGTLTASPSLHCIESAGGCGFHGWLQNGVIAE